MPTEAATWWLRMALGDLAAARALLGAPGVAPRHVAYLAEQATEKALKATIALEGGEPPLTHDLVFLLARTPAEAGLRLVPCDIVALSAAQTLARYPDPEEPPYDREEVDHLVADASCFVAAVQGHFDRRGHAGTDLAPV